MNSEPTPADMAAPSGPPGQEAADGRVNPLAVTVAQAAKVLSAVGVGRVTEEMIQRHITAGAPTASDGRINMVHYAAWLNQRAGRDEHGA